MSMSSDDAFSQDHISMVLEMAREPSYVSEIARKLEEYGDNWGLTGSASVERAAIITSMVGDREAVTIFEVGYGDDESGQVEASPIHSLTGHDEESEGYKWNPYTLVHYTNDIEIRDEFQDVVDPSIPPEDKADMITVLSGRGNDVSRQAEEIMQDVMERQFRHYEEVEIPGYNDPDVDFYVNDPIRREWGLAIEVSTRWVNPIGSRYLDEKMEKAQERDADLLIMAPRFTGNLLRKHEDPEDEMENQDPVRDLVHLHTVPTMEPDVYQPFAKEPSEINDRESGGNPIIIRDFRDVRDRLTGDDEDNREFSPSVGDSYPVVDDRYEEMIEYLDKVHREYTVITESMYRNEIRESMEPLLWEFMRPYQIEQFLVDTYWGKFLNQREIGNMVDRNKSTIGDWMGNWDIPTRQTDVSAYSGETLEIWSRMYMGEPPFQDQDGNGIEHSGYRVLAEYNRHPLWDLDDWDDWYSQTTRGDRQDVMAKQSSHKDMVEYTLMMGPSDQLNPSYSAVLSALKDVRDGVIELGLDFEVEIRDEDEAPRVPYNAYPSRKALEYMINKNHDTIVEVSEGGNDA